LSFLK